METEKIREIVRGVVRACRESHPEVQRPFMNEMACFCVQATFLQRPGLCRSFVDGIQNKEVIGRCVKLLTLEDCPAIETIQLQIRAQGVMFLEKLKLKEEKWQHEQRLDKIMQDIVNMKVQDTRKLPKETDNLHRLVSEFVMENSNGMDRSLNSTLLVEAEMRTALDSVFPRRDFIYWMDLQDLEKASQLQEISYIIPGICAYNRNRWKSSRDCQLPFDIFDEESQILGKRVKDELDDVKKRIHAYREAISLHIDSLGIGHVLMQRLRDEMIYEIQLMSLLQELEFDLNEMGVQARKLSASFCEHLKLLHKTIGTHKCVPNELVYPKFYAVGFIQRKASEEVKYLKALSKKAAALLLLSKQPSFRRTPVGSASLAADSGLSKLGIMAKNCEFLPAYIYTTNCAQADMFMTAPHDALMNLEMIITMLPQIVNLMGCQHDACFSNLEIAQIFQIVNQEPLCGEFSTQTGEHIQPEHQFDEESLCKRALQLYNKQTHSTQTIFSHFQRDSNTQVWKPKDESSQSLFGKGTTMPKRVKYFENLRGPPDCKFNTVEITMNM